MLILPRQARDIHKKSSKKVPFSRSLELEEQRGDVEREAWPELREVAIPHPPRPPAATTAAATNTSSSSAAGGAGVRLLRSAGVLDTFLGNFNSGGDVATRFDTYSPAGTHTDTVARRPPKP